MHAYACTLTCSVEPAHERLSGNDSLLVDHGLVRRVVSNILKTLMMNLGTNGPWK